MQLFNEYEHKDTTHKTEIELIRKSDIQLSGWELGNLLSKMAIYTYRFELIDTISLALQNGIDPKNIIILDHSFELNTSYSDLEFVSLESRDIVNIYNIGRPISLFPNDEIFKLNILFRLIYNINEKFKDNHIRKVPVENLCKYINRFSALDGENIISDFYNDLVETYRFKDDEKILSEINNIFEEIKKINNKYITDAVERESIDRQLRNNESRVGKYNHEIYKEYFEQFYFYLMNIPRPVVGIYYEEDKKIQVLCVAHINRKLRNETFFDIKSISHNSPLEVIIQIGTAATILLGIIYKYDENRRAREKHQKEVHLIDKQTETEEMKQEALSVYISRHKLSIEKPLDNRFVQDRLEHSAGKVIRNFENTLYSNKIALKSEKIKVIKSNIDYRV
jgi:hypothetical protein